jgi:hypothetical protein
MQYVDFIAGFDFDKLFSLHLLYNIIIVSIDLRGVLPVLCFYTLYSLNKSRTHTILVSVCLFVVQHQQHDSAEVPLEIIQTNKVRTAPPPGTRPHILYTNRRVQAHGCAFGVPKHLISMRVIPHKSPVLGRV